MGKPYKQNKKGAVRHVQLLEWLQASDAWSSLKPGPRALYVEIKRRFNGRNNGELFLSHRDAAKLLNVGRDTVGRYYSELQDAGFILQTAGHCLGPSGKGQSAKWALTEHPLNEAPATKDFMTWKKQKPRQKIQPFLAGKSNTPCRKIQHMPIQRSDNPTAFGQKHPILVSDNPAIYTSSHIPKVLDFSKYADLNLCPLLNGRAA